MRLTKMISALFLFFVYEGRSDVVPVLSPIGIGEIVWNKSADACPKTKISPVTGKPVLCEEPDSMPIAWHNPLKNESYLISSTDCTFPAIAPSLWNITGKHNCSASPYVAKREAAPWTYNNHQWLQSAIVFENGTGFALIHNEFHGEQAPHNSSWCSVQKETSPKRCVLWSTDSGVTQDGGATWHLRNTPIIALPKKYMKDEEIAGYGALGQIQYYDGYFYSNVGFNYAGTGLVPSDKPQSGTCVFRTRNLADPRSFRGWNGSHWTTQWVNPYVNRTSSDQLWRRICADISLFPTSASHLSMKKFEGPLTKIPGWPQYVMSGLSGKGAEYYFPSGQAEPFTSWKSNGVVNIETWLDPCTIGGKKFKMMYPSLLDHDSPFDLARYVNQSRFGNEYVTSMGYSYGLVGNTSLFLYFIYEREFIVRVPVAWFHPNQTLPKGPFSPPSTVPPDTNSVSCIRINVTGASDIYHDVDGVYHQVALKEKDGTYRYKMDENHFIYHFQNHWVLGNPSVERYISAPADLPGQGKGVPKTWGPCNNISVICIDR